MNNKSRNNLEGFEDLLDLVDKKKRYSGQREEKIGSEFDVQTFLEQERDRLDKIYSFLNSKANVLNNYSQLPALKTVADHEIEKKEKELKKMLSEDNSIFNNNLDTLFRQFFPSN